MAEVAPTRESIVLRDKLVGIPSMPGVERDEALKPYYKRKAAHLPSTSLTFRDRQQVVDSDASFLTDFYRRRMVAVGRALEFLAGTPQKKHFALVDMVAFHEYKGQGGRLSLREANQLFDERMGGVVIPADMLEAPVEPSTRSREALEDFFSLRATTQDAVGSGRRIFRTASGVDLRGEGYYAVYDSENPNSEVKLDGVVTDLVDGLEALSKVDRTEITSPRDYLLYLGLLDYLKAHSLTIYQGVTYYERLEMARLSKLSKRYQDKLKTAGTIRSESISDNPSIPLKTPKEFEEYQRNKQWSDLVGRKFTNMFYQALLGLDHDTAIDIAQIQQIFRGLGEYIKTESAKGNDLSKRLRYPEAQHPLVIALGAQEACRLYPDIDLIVGIPTGGTETSIVTQIIYGMMRPADTPSPKLVQIPISLHSEIYPAPGSDSVAEFMKRFYPGAFSGKKVLVIDDNSETGQTLSTVTKSLRKEGAKSTNVHITEFSSRKVIRATSTSSFNSEISPTTMGIHLVVDNDEPAYLHEIKKRRLLANTSSL